MQTPRAGTRARRTAAAAAASAPMRRSAALNERRRAALLALRARSAGVAWSVEDVLAAFIGPYLDLSRDGGPGWKTYGRLIAHLAQDNRWLGLIERQFNETTLLVRDALGARPLARGRPAPGRDAGGLRERTGPLRGGRARAVLRLHLLGEKGEVAAFGPLCRLFLDAEASDLVLGDAITTTLRGILISTYDGDLATLQAAIEKAEAEEYVREGALLVLAYLTRTSRVPEVEMRAYLRHLLAEMQPRRRGFVPHDWLRVADFRRDLKRTLDDPERMAGFTYDRIGPFKDAIDELEGWNAFSGEDEDEPAPPSGSAGMKPFPSVAVIAAAPWIALGAPLSPHARSDRCGFDFGRQQYAGSEVEQARCLLPRFIGPENLRAAPGPSRPSLGQPLESLVGTAVSLPKRAVRDFLASAGLNALAETLDRPLSRTARGTAARYFVIHGTNANVGAEPFPADDAPAMTRLGLTWEDGRTWRAHAWVNRLGAIRVTYDFGRRPTRASTKFEAAHSALLGLFLHTELTQPRRAPASAPDLDIYVPVPAFTEAQYRSVALLYVVASVRAGRWLVPAYHVAIDQGIPRGHDDPQHFSLERFSAALGQILRQIENAPSRGG